jgi:hypothetical protein
MTLATGMNLDHDTSWKPQDAAQLLHPTLASRLSRPWRERRFVYARYAAFLDRLADRARFEVVPLRDFAAASARERPVVGLRHDVDDRLESALRLAELEHDRGLRATYFVLHTASYYERDDLIGHLLRLQELGHEVGWHNDLVTLQLVEGVDARSYLSRELSRLRAAGIAVTGTAAHGSEWCHRLGFHNNYVFAGWDEPLPGFPATDVPDKLAPADFGLEYEAYHLDNGLYFSDSSFDAAGNRWHPALFDADAVQAGDKVIVLVHPCHWDASAGAKAVRLARSALQRSAGRLPRR